MYLKTIRFDTLEIIFENTLFRKKKYFLFRNFLKFREVCHYNTDISAILKVFWLIFYWTLLTIRTRQPFKGLYNWTINDQVTDRTRWKKKNWDFCLPQKLYILPFAQVIRYRFKNSCECSWWSCQAFWNRISLNFEF